MSTYVSTLVLSRAHDWRVGLANMLCKEMQGWWRTWLGWAQIPIVLFLLAISVV